MFKSILALMGVLSPAGLIVPSLFAEGAENLEQEELPDGDAAHHALFSEIPFPSAMECAVCHPEESKAAARETHALLAASELLCSWWLTMLPKLCPTARHTRM